MGRTVCAVRFPAKVRPLALLRVHHEKIEAWILEQAGIVFDTKPGKLSVVNQKVGA